MGQLARRLCNVREDFDEQWRRRLSEWIDGKVIMEPRIERGDIDSELLLTQMLEEDASFRAEWERTSYARAVANEIVRYRIDHGLTQTALARLIGVSQAAIGRLELGEHEPKISTLQKLSQVLGLTFVVTIHPGIASSGLESPASVEVSISAA